MNPLNNPSPPPASGPPRGADPDARAAKQRLLLTLTVRNRFLKEVTRITLDRLLSLDAQKQDSFRTGFP
jgi:hypothetical protein